MPLYVQEGLLPGAEGTAPGLGTAVIIIVSINVIYASMSHH